MLSAWDGDPFVEKRQVLEALKTLERQAEGKLSGILEELAEKFCAGASESAAMMFKRIVRHVVEMGKVMGMLSATRWYVEQVLEGAEDDPAYGQRVLGAVLEMQRAVMAALDVHVKELGILQVQRNIVM